VDLATSAPDDSIRSFVLDKINVIRDRRYVARGKIELLMNHFAVSKGDTDVRVVYDGTLSGLNASLWAPYLPLPKIQSHYRIVEPGTYMADNDVGECFLHWILDERARKWCGIDLSLFFDPKLEFGKGGKGVRWVFDRHIM
jgi:hypothetical protein